MPRRPVVHFSCIFFSLAPLLTLIPTKLMALSGEGLAWEGPLERVVASFQGPVAKGIAVLVIIATGLGYAFGESGSVFKKGMAVVFGLSLALGASAFVANLFGFGSGFIGQ